MIIRAMDIFISIISSGIPGLAAEKRKKEKAASGNAKAKAKGKAKAKAKAVDPEPEEIPEEWPEDDHAEDDVDGLESELSVDEDN